MCGINAVFSKVGKLTMRDAYLYRRLFMFTQLRGDDASGLCWDTQEVEESSAYFLKTNIPAENFVDIYVDDFLGMKGRSRWAFGHARLATQGSPKRNVNNHPVISRDKRLLIVHNGVVWMPRIEGYKYQGKVDTEILLSYIDKYGLKKGLQEVRGSAAIILASFREGYRAGLHLWRHLSPMVIGETETAYFIASTEELLTMALGNHLKKVEEITSETLYLLTAKGLTTLDRISPKVRYSTGYNYRDGDDYWLGRYGIGGYNSQTFQRDTDPGVDLGDDIIPSIHIPDTISLIPIKDYNEFLKGLKQKPFTKVGKKPQRKSKTSLLQREFGEDFKVGVTD